MFDDDIIKRFAERNRENTELIDNTPVSLPNRFSTRCEVTTNDGRDVLLITLFDYYDVIDCSKHTIPPNLTDSKAIVRWGLKRLDDFREEIIECIG